MRELFFRFKITAIFGLLIAALVGVAPAAAQSGARVYLQPVSESGDTVTVDVVAENVTDLYGLEFLLSYDPAAVEVIDLRPEQDGVQLNPGTLLPVEQGFVVANQANPGAGTISFAMTLLNPAPPVSGSGPLAQLSLRKLNNAPTVIDLADVKLVAASLEIIPAQTTGLTLNAAGQPGAVAAAPAPSPATESSFPWWIVAVGIIVLGLITLGAFLVFGNPTRSDPATPPVQQRPAGSRPSAFK
ncbi:MAG: hypothetical protein Kow0031_39960 [Anaerolineae bacterium]